MTAVAPASSKSNIGLIVGIVAGVGLIGIFFVGLLAAIAIPNLLTAIDRSKQKRSMADMRSIAAAIDAYVEEKGEYPQGTDAEDLKRILEPEYAALIPTKDGWDGKIRYACWKEDPNSIGCDQFRLVSAGKDGILENMEYQKYQAKRTTDFDCDIVFGPDQFVQSPEGIQL